MIAFVQFLIQRPIAVLGITCVILLFGLYVVCVLPIRLYPALELPVVSITTHYAGSSSNLMQTSITQPIEESLSGLEQVDYIDSSSDKDSSTINIHFNLNTPVHLLMPDLLNRIASIRSDLPKNSTEPVIAINNTDNDPLMIIAYLSPHRLRAEMGEYLRNTVKPRLESIQGVASADVMADKPALRVWLESTRLAEYNKSPSDIVHQIQDNFSTVPLGQVVNATRHFALTTEDPISITKSLNNLPMADQGYLTLRNLSHVQWGSESTVISSVMDGLPATMMFIHLLPSANPLMVSHQLHFVLNQLNKSLPMGSQLTVTMDRTLYIQGALYELLETMVISLCIVFFVIQLIFKNRVLALITFFSIPLSLISTFIFLWLMHDSIDTLSLLGIVIASGLVVDDTMIIIEHIMRYRQRGYAWKEAISHAVNELCFSVVGISIILVAVYLPMVLIKGLMGKLFSELMCAVAISVVISAVVSLTIIPVVCYLCLHQKPYSYHPAFLVSAIEKIYENGLRVVFNYKKIILIIWASCFVGAVGLWLSLPKELAPPEDQGFLRVLGRLPDAASDSFLSHKSNELEKNYKKTHLIDHYIMLQNIPTLHQFLSLISIHANQPITAHFVKNLTQLFNQIVGLKVAVMMPSALPIPETMPIEFVLKSSENSQDLWRQSEIIKKQAIRSGLFSYLDQDVQYDMPAFLLSVNRALAFELGIHLNDILHTIQWQLNESLGKIIDFQNQQYHLILHVNPVYSNEVEVFNNLQIRNKQGEMIPLSSLVSFRETVVPNQLNRFQGMSSVTLSGIMKPGVSIEKGVQILEKSAKPYPLIIPDYSGSLRFFIQEKNHRYFLFLLGLISVYLILAILFENTRKPILILLGTLPMTVFFALCALFYMNMSLNIYSQLALLTLMGLMAKHGILITTVANTLQSQEHYSSKEAIIKACLLRLRPILMTTFAMAGGFFPLLCMSGYGAAARSAVGAVLVPGVLLGTFSMLFIFPVIYSLSE